MTTGNGNKQWQRTKATSNGDDEMPWPWGCASINGPECLVGKLRHLAGDFPIVMLKSRASDPAGGKGSLYSMIVLGNLATGVDDSDAGDDSTAGDDATCGAKPKDDAQTSCNVLETCVSAGDIASSSFLKMDSSPTRESNSLTSCGEGTGTVVAGDGARVVAEAVPGLDT